MNQESDGQGLGLVHVYTGNGKGKTTAAIGAGIRAAGHGYAVKMVQFMKGEWFPEYGEIKVIMGLENFEVEQFATKHFLEPDDIRPEDREAIGRAMDASRKAVSDNSNDVVILDEITVACEFGLISPDDILDLIERKGETMELIITGRYAPDEVIDKGDIVTRMEKVKHPYDQGVKAQKGREW